jgi:hypothetical protein
MAEGGMDGEAVRIGRPVIIISLLLSFSFSILYAIRCIASANCGDNGISASGSCDIGCRGGWVC